NIAKYSGEKEIIISDGRSSDNTIEIAKKYTDKIVVFNGEGRQTIANARNEGAKAAKGDFLVFFDADVLVFDPNIFFKRLLSNFEKDKRLIGATVAIRVLKDKERFLDKMIFSFSDLSYTFLNNMIHFGGASGEFQFIRAEAFRKIGGFNEKLPVSEDQDMFIRLSKIGRTYFDGKLTVYHTGRRAHKIGWAKLLYQWLTNYFSVVFFNRSAQDEWKEIR
ncbi:MAG: glycosyltransferase family 2 protein, partial [Candidatus Paceibacterota bacterium]